MTGAGAPRALVVFGGWEGHQPEKGAEFVAALLSAEGFDVRVTSDIDALGGADVADMRLVVPVVTNAAIDRATVERLGNAVRAGVGLGGFHHCLAASFRSAVNFHYIAGVQWVAHPGDIVDFRVDVTRPDDPVMRGIGGFDYRSEQYYLHVDPSIEVLATTNFSGEHDAVTAGVTMPVVFKRRFGEGRVFWSALGHLPVEFERFEPREILRRGLLWAAGRDEAT